MRGSLPLWLHIVSATVWVGSQVMMFAVVVPAVRSIDEGRARYRFLAALTPRFGWLGGGALVVLVLTGVDNVRRYAPSSGVIFDVRYGYILVAKLIMVALVILRTVYHGAHVGPKLLRLQGEALAGQAASAASLPATRLQSVLISSLTLILSLLILLCATLLRTSFGGEAA